jgi:hypothetical protein
MSGESDTFNNLFNNNITVKSNYYVTTDSQSVLMAPEFTYKFFPAMYNTLAGLKVQSYKYMSYLKQTKQPYKLSMAYLSMLMLLQAGDLHPNPGPYQPKFPCAVCGKAVKWGQRATCCDKCDLWYHVDCMDMCSPTYDALVQSSNMSWICCQCGFPNFASSLFSDFSINISNSFASLTTLSTDSESIMLSPPAATSSPKYKFPSHSLNSSTGATKPKTNKPSMRVKRQSIKTMVIHFCSVRSKVADLAVNIENYNPDVIIGTETH